MFRFGSNKLVVCCLGIYPDNLRQFMTPIMDHDLCNSRMKDPRSSYDPVDNTMICGGRENGNKGSCSVSTSRCRHLLPIHLDYYNSIGLMC